LKEIVLGRHPPPDDFLGFELCVAFSKPVGYFLSIFIAVFQSHGTFAVNSPYLDDPYPYGPYFLPVLEWKVSLVKHFSPLKDAWPYVILVMISPGESLTVDAFPPF